MTFDTWLHSHPHHKHLSLMERTIAAEAWDAAQRTVWTPGNAPAVDGGYLITRREGHVISDHFSDEQWESSYPENVIAYAVRPLPYKPMEAR